MSIGGSDVNRIALGVDNLSRACQWWNMTSAFTFVMKNTLSQSLW